MIILAGLVLLGSTPMIVQVLKFDYDSFISTEIVTILCILFGIPAFFGIMFLICSTIAFNANVIQFGIDQLHDAPAESLTLYIHWLVWTSQVGVFLIRLPAASVFSYGIKDLVYASSPGLILLANVFFGQQRFFLNFETM